MSVSAVNQLGVEKIFHENSLIAIILSNDVGSEVSLNKSSSVNFFTPANFSQQLGLLVHRGGTQIQPHIHKQQLREVMLTQEVLVIKKGKVRVDFYTLEQVYIESRILESGDVILLASGGHGFEVIEDCEMIEVKQGPFLPESDKIRFEPSPRVVDSSVGKLDSQHGSFLP